MIVFPISCARARKDIFPVCVGAYNNVDPTPKWRHYGAHVHKYTYKKS